MSAPSKTFDVSAPWTPTALVVAALMRRMGVSEVVLTPDELEGRGGLLLASDGRVQLQEGGGDV